MNGDETEGLGAVGGNPAAATEELKPLERLGPARLGAECQRSDTALRVWERRCAEQRNTGCHSLASPLALGRCVSSVADDTSGEDGASVKEIKAKPYLFSRQVWCGRNGALA